MIVPSHGSPEACVPDALSDPARRALRVSENRYRRLFETAQDGILLLNVDTAQIEDVNPYLIKMLGYSHAEFLRKKLWEVGSFTDIAQSKEMFAELQTTGYVRYMDLPLKTKAGAIIPVEFISNTYDCDGIKVIQCNIRNITERKRAKETLQDSEKQFAGAFNNAPIGMALVMPDGRWLKVNLALCDLVGYSETELLTCTFQDITHPDDIEVDLEYVRRMIAGEIHSYHMEKRYIHKRGRLVTVLLNVSVVRDGQGQPLYFISQIQDITERKKAEARIVFLNRSYAMLSGINTLIVRTLDCDELFREACRIAVETGEYHMSLICIVDRSTMKIVPVASAGKDERLLTAIKNILSSSEDAPDSMIARAISEKKIVVANDSQSDHQVLFAKQYAESGVLSIAVLPLIVSDAAIGVLALYTNEIDFFHEKELKLLKELAGNIAFAKDHIDKQERLDYLAYYDVLTGLANRTLFLERVTQHIRSAVNSGHKLALFLIDLERFKNINDSLGRPAGDAILIQVAEWLTRNVGDVNLLARLGADHFACVLPQVMQEGDVTRLIEKLSRTLTKHPFCLDDAVFRISAKTGVAIFPDDGTDADILFRNAEAALKKAKAGGDRYLFYAEKMTAAVAAKLTLENQLRQAFDKEEFVLHYQPKVNLVSGKVTSVEALIRWNDPRADLVPPGRFILALEETGLIYDVGRWALRRAIEDYLRWRNAGLAAVRIAVNVSPLQLRNHGFIDEIRQVIGVDAQAAAGLELEITESLIMEDVQHSIASLQTIRAMGVTIAIDDFGTGFSSLSYLSKLPVDTLKIDRSFVIRSGPGNSDIRLSGRFASQSRPKGRIQEQGHDQENETEPHREFQSQSGIGSATRG